MPRRYRKRYSKRARRTKRPLRVSLAQARSKRVDNTAELVIQTIAKREALKAVRENQIRLINRMYFFSNIDQATNVHVGGHLLDFDGVCEPQSRIPKTDIEFLIAIPPPDIPDTLMLDESAPPSSPNAGNAPVGSGKGMLDTTRHGYRGSDFVRVSGWSIDIRAFRKRVLPADNFRYDNATVWWRLISVRMNESTGDPEWCPTVDEVGPFLKPWGYSSKLDIQEADESQRSVKYRVICKGSFSIHPSTTGCVQKNFGHYHKFKKPLLITYHPTDQNGLLHTKDSLFLMMRSQIPSTGGYVAEKPSVEVCTKLFYTDS